MDRVSGERHRTDPRRRVAGTLLAVVAAIALVAPLGPVTPTAAAAVGAPGKGLPVADQGNITIKAGGARAANGTIAPLAGATFQFYQATSTGARGALVDGATCTTDGTGMCNVTLAPRFASTGGQNATPYGYIAVATAVPAGYTLIDQVTTGTTANRSTVALEYQTGPVYADTAYTVPATVAAATTRNQTTSGTAMPASADNPALAVKCGLNVALLVDVSTSVSNSGSVNALKTAATAYVNALAGTPSRVAIQTFGTTSPSSGTGNSTLGLTSVATTTGAQTVRDKVAGLTVPTNNGTNWDAGFRGVSTLADQGLDVVVMITDGLPTYYNVNGDGSGSTTRFIELEHAVASANAVKQSGVTVQAIGVGSGIAGSPANLVAVSGPTANTDYFAVSDYTALQQTMRTLASGGCASTVNVTKLVRPAGGGAPVATSGWQMAADAATPIVKVSGSTDEFATSAQAATGSTGAVSFQLNQPIDTDDDVHVVEDTVGGYSLELQDGDNAACTNSWTTESVAVENDADGPGFTVNVPQGAIVSCQIINQAETQTAMLEVDKQWWFDLDGDGEDLDGPYGPDDVLPIANLSAALTLSGDGVGLPDGPHYFGTTYGNLVPGGTVDVGETVTGLPPLCTNEATGTGDVGLEPTGDDSSPFVNAVTVVNTVTCESRLTLEKWVESTGPATADDWELSASAIDATGALPGPQGAVSGREDATSPVTPEVRYALGEEGTTGGSSSYVQRWNPSLTGQWNDAAANGATGSWLCVTAAGVGDDGTPTWGTDQFDGRNGGVTVSAGQWAKCTAENVAEPELELVKTVAIDGRETTQGAERWTLGAAWTSPVAPDPAGGTFTPPREQEPVSGAGGVERQPVLPGGYVPTESTVAGYENGETWTCTLDSQPDAPFPLGTGQIDLPDGEGASCEIVNTAIQPTLQLVKEVAGGGPATPTDWVLAAEPTEVVDPVAPTVTDPDGGDTEVTDVYTNTGYAFSEAPRGDFDDRGYTAGDWTCEDTSTDPASAVAVSAEGTIPALTVGQAVVCTVTNTAVPPTLSLAKEVVSSDPDVRAADWTLTGTGASSSVTGDGTATGQVAVDEDIALTEAPAGDFDATGYTPGDWACQDAEGEDVALDVDGPGAATLPGLTVGESVTCTITNTADEPSLALDKIVDAGGDERYSDADWTLSGAYGDDDVNPDGEPGDVAAAPVTIGTDITLGEAWAREGEADGGFDLGAWACQDADGADVAVTAGGPGTATLPGLGAGQHVTCTVTNTAIPPELQLDKQVSGGTDREPSDWTLSGEGDAGTTLRNPGSSPGAEAPVQVVGLGESFVLDEAPNGWDDSGYDKLGWTCAVVDGPAAPEPEIVTRDDGSAALAPLAPGQQVRCEAQNRAVDPVLHLVKEVEGGDGTPEDWVLTGAVDGRTIVNPDGAPGNVPGTAVPAQVSISLAESAVEGLDESEWTHGSWACTLDDGPGAAPAVEDLGGGAGELSGLEPGQEATCVIVNSYAGPAPSPSPSPEPSGGTPTASPSTGPGGPGAEAPPTGLGSLPITGADLVPWLAAALAAIALGVAGVVVSRSRRRDG
ncbi:hypothetical protein [Isoptericola sp. NPDC057559]|uniref:hypothetical protein n=1 Tax=Isoptericola sp. NPDC057559 TaxID=3346168 RepID=UPI003681F183